MESRLQAPIMAQRHCFPKAWQPDSASSQNLSAGGAVPDLTPAWDPADCPGHLMHSLLPVPLSSLLGPYYLNHCI